MVLYWMLLFTDREIDVMMAALESADFIQRPERDSALSTLQNHRKDVIARRDKRAVSELESEMLVRQESFPQRKPGWPLS